MADPSSIIIAASARLLDVIRSQFLSGYNNISETELSQILAEHSEWDAQKQFLDRTILDPIVIAYPLKWSYQISFIKRCIAILQKITPEVHDLFYENLVRLQNQESQEWVFKHYVLSADDKGAPVVIKEKPQIISEGTTGLCAWQAGIFLANWMCENAKLFENKSILELGSGTGLTGIVAAKQCALSRITLTDCHSQVLRLLEENVALNGCRRDTVRVLHLNWDSPSLDNVDGLSPPPDYVLAADVVYDETIFQPLVNVLTLLSSRNSRIKIILASTVRNSNTLTEFLALIERSGFYYRLLVTATATGDNHSHRPRSSLLHWEASTEIRLFEIVPRLG